MSEEILNTRIPEEMAGMRLDAALAELFPDYSRSRIQGWIKQGNVQLNGQHPKARDKVIGREAISLKIEIEALDSEVIAEDVPLKIVYEDDDVIVINKPAGLVVHPAAGNWSGTLQNGLLFHDSNLKTIPRAGIVHRLDKDTSGLLVVARSLIAHKSLTDQLQARTVHREYQAVVNGVLTAGNTIDLPIGRHPRDRKKMTVREDGRQAVTHYRVIQRYRAHTHISVKLETGRTHQIRVHMSHQRNPIVGDSTYGGRVKLPKHAEPDLVTTLQEFKRQALHAAKLGFIHPTSNEEVSWQADLPDDMKKLLTVLEHDRLNNET